MKIRLTYFFVGVFLNLFILNSLKAQSDSKESDFQVDYVKGCSEFTVEITNLMLLRPGGTVQYDIDYQGDPDAFDQSAVPHDFGSGNVIGENEIVNHTYTTPGTYILFQWSTGLDPSGDGTTWHDWIAIEVVDPQDLEFNWFVCGNEGISIEIEDTFYDSYQIDFNDPSSPGVVIFTPGDPIPTHTYAVGGTYNVVVSGMFDGNVGTCHSLTKSVTTSSTINPVAIEQLEITVINAVNGELELTFSGGLDNIQYLVQSSPDGTFSWDSLFLFSASSIVTIPNQNTSDPGSAKCYRIVPYDFCDPVDPLGVPSETICSTVLFDIDARDSENVLSWETVSFNFKKFEVVKNGAVLIDSLDLSGASDQDIFCNTQYCYQIITHYTNGLRSISGTQCAPGISQNIAPIENATTSVDGNDITLTWVPPANTDIGEYIINRSENGGTFNEIARTDTNTLIDSGLQVDQTQYCYEIYYQSGCDDQFSEKLETCAILLTGELQGGDIRLNWTPYLGWENGISIYIIERLDENGNVVESFVPSSDSFFRDNDAANNGLVFTYTIRAIPSGGGLLQAYSNVVTITFDSQVFVPNAFTPNGDGVNDVFQPVAFMTNEYKIRIFNRWGEMVFHSESADVPWYGFFDGEPAPQSLYTYIIEFVDQNGGSKTQAGKVLLLRN